MSCEYDNAANIDKTAHMPRIACDYSNLKKWIQLTAYKANLLIVLIAV